MIFLLACATSPPLPERLEAAVVQDACQLCIFQRNGSRADILRRMARTIETDEVNFGHCFACIRCPGEGAAADCRGFSPMNLDIPAYPAQPGFMYRDNTEAWDRVDCMPILPRQAEALLRYTLSYAEENTYQVINRQGGRSCMGFCEDIATAAGMPPALRSGNLTVPGAMRFPDAVFQMNEPADMTPAELTRSLLVTPH